MSSRMISRLPFFNHNAIESSTGSANAEAASQPTVVIICRSEVQKFPGNWGNRGRVKGVVKNFFDIFVLV